VDGLAGRIVSVRLLTGSQRLTYHQDRGKLVIETPREAPDENDSVLAVETH
jgi:hypothetical protein